MRILFTGSSSFSGMWFIQELAKAGHEVTAVFQQPRDAYSGTRLERLKKIEKVSRPIYACRFGDDSFMKLVAESSWALFCHHAADVTNYKSPDFNVASALGNNTHNLKAVLTALKKQGCNKVALTGSVFEQFEGAGSDQLCAVSPYGLSKGLTSDVFTFYTSNLDIRLGKFVVPNPFGPYEEKRFTSFLIDAWFRKLKPPVDFPFYVRDNIHVSLMAKAYVDFIASLPEIGGFQKLNPSGYPESQGAFTLRFAREMAQRLNIPCEVDLKQQKQFLEPKVRINTDVLNSEKLGWDETAAWDELAAYYLQQHDLHSS